MILMRNEVGGGKKATFYHYCEQCDTELIAEYKQSESYLSEVMKKDIDSILEFADIQTCPVCGASYSTNTKHHIFFSNERIGTTARRDDFLKGKRKYMHTHYSRGYIECSALENQYDVNKLKNGDEIEYQRQIGIFVSVSSDGKYCNINFYNNNLESKLAYARRYRTKEKNKDVKKKIDTFVSKVNVDFESKKTKIAKDNIKLIEYLQNIMLLEKNIFLISERLKNLYMLDIEMGRDIIALEKTNIYKSKEKVDNLLKEYNTLLSSAPIINVTLEQFKFRVPNKPEEPIKPQMPVLEKPKWFNKKKVESSNALLTKMYEEQYSSYEKEMMVYNDKLSKYKEKVDKLKKEQKDKYLSRIEEIKQEHQEKCLELKTQYEEALLEYKNCSLDDNTIYPQKVHQTYVKKEIAQAEELLKKLYTTRNELYSYDIIFKKYRDFVSISAFYEYLSSGRCDSLEGHEGAYNIYENEIRMNTVIAQLTQVIESLEEIKKSQNVIYAAITESNRQLKLLNSSMYRAISSINEIKATTSDMKGYMKKIEENTELIAYNTERISFYAKKNAELTNALGYIAALS